MEKFLDVKEINGHSWGILQSLDENKITKSYILKHKGKGVSFFENNNSWHAVVTKKIYDDAISEIEK